MFCPKCGKENDNSSKFCESCGEKLVSNAVENTNIIGSQTGKTASRQINQSSNNVISVDNTMHTTQPVTISKSSGISRKAIIIIIEIIAIISLMYLFKVNVDKEYGPEKAAERYFLNLTEGKLSDVYSSLDINEEKFLNEKTFFNAVNLSNDTIRGNISNYSVKIKQNDGYRVKAEITYQTKTDANNDQTMEITLSKSGKKKFFFFDEWIVGNNIDMVENYRIYVPDGSNVLIDGIDVIKNAKKTDSTDSLVGYQIDKIFSGNHVIEFKSNIFQNTKEIVGIYKDEENQVYIPDIKLSEEVVKDITDDSINYMKQYLDYAINQKSVSGLSNIIKISNYENLESNYNSFCDEITSYFFETVHPSTANITDIHVNFYTKGISDDEEYYDENYTGSNDFGYVEINANATFKYPDSSVDDLNKQLTQKYYYGLSDGELIVTYIENEFNEDYDY